MKIQGIIPAVLTPFVPSGGVDFDRFHAHVDRLYRAGVDGIYVGGNAGEWYAMSLEERKALAAAAVSASRGRGLALVHVGAARIEDSIELARHAEDLGADGISSLPPYTQGWSMPEVRCWFERLAGATDLPFLIYYFPRLTGGATGESFFEAMRPVGRIAGYKFTDMNLFDLGLLLEGPYTVLNGHDPNLSAALRMGADGGIGSFYNIAADFAVAMLRANRSGDAAGAERIQAQLNRTIRIVRGYRLIPALKHICGLQGFDQGMMRDPMLPLGKDEQQRLSSEWEVTLCAR
ncbi:MAG: dihydrodipicolinate synthase family protein [Bryobacteraceae bacterium]|nr:dihydrodipicolinate synthase family protein [Bryobacteraceae bacterium]